jgi:hypothetical protein
MEITGLKLNIDTMKKLLIIALLAIMAAGNQANAQVFADAVVLDTTISNTRFVYLFYGDEDRRSFVGERDSSQSGINFYIRCLMLIDNPFINDTIKDYRIKTGLSWNEMGQPVIDFLYPWNIKVAMRNFAIQRSQEHFQNILISADK